MLSFLKAFSLTSLIFVASVNAERHTVHFENKCGRGTPRLVQDGKILSRGKDFTIKGPLEAAIAYLQTGSCGLNGDGCTIVEATLVNPTEPGSGSSADISLIPPLKFSVPSGFSYFNGCDGDGADCKTASCPNAFRKPDDTDVQVGCQEDDVNLKITFCE
ncbi:hypothetical protein AMATHDRAFT_6695 [Amanita thiersii Skay4041]|uniref:Glycopeptide n=1 Tax=Amanita thiersii Skay4041 TaxID=703135 RepID=A0A2A9NBP7_9AGAR|nr:hypothetical protein AMATHDRAFT_6695 [Amanita thiersii Skay4041]